ncbi:MBL fold metallo-hydrolase [Nitrospinae bacterium AH_259_B05_G02_I21]|nr:MBL fold metallo-hydrolase [Nitrospinae bacterium AH_259_B05_G02_I21]
MAIAVTCFTVSQLAENTYLIGCDETKEAIFIDPGDEPARLLKAAEDSGFTVTKIVNTHGHFDHVGAVMAIKEALEVPFYLHKDDEPLLERLLQVGPMFGIGDGRLPVVDHYLEVGQTVEVGNLSAEILFTPGHAPGHVSLHFADEGCVFSGDVLFAGSIGRTDLPGGSIATLMRSIEQVLLALPPETVVYPGHGPSTTIGHEKDHNPFLTGGGPFLL